MGNQNQRKTGHGNLAILIVAFCCSCSLLIVGAAFVNTAAMAMNDLSAGETANGPSGSSAFAKIGSDDGQGGTSKLSDQDSDDTEEDDSSDDVQSDDDSAADDDEDSSDDYIFPDSDTVRLTKSDLVGYTDDELCRGMNEIWARHGRKFKNKWLQRYFNKQDWYSGTIAPDRFNSVYKGTKTENKNAELINSVLLNHGYNVNREHPNG